MEPIAIPRYIDDQIQILYWELDEVAVFFMCMGLGIMFDMLMPLMLGALVFLYMFQRFKMTHMDGILLHIAYWNGIVKLNNAHPNGLMRRYHS